MRIDGQWLVCDDGILRPVVEAQFLCQDGSWIATRLLIDTGADRTVLNAGTLHRTGLERFLPSEALGGVGGATDSVIVYTNLRLTDARSNTLVAKGQFAAFTEPTALDMSVLGRDITNLFALIVDRPGDVVSLVGQDHRYHITPG